MTDEGEDGNRKEDWQQERNEEREELEADAQEQVDGVEAVVDTAEEPVAEDDEGGLPSWFDDALDRANADELDLTDPTHRRLLGKANHEELYREERDEDGDLSPMARQKRREVVAAANQKILAGAVTDDAAVYGRDALPGSLAHELFGAEMYDPQDVEERVAEAQDALQAYVDEQVDDVAADVEQVSAYVDELVEQDAAYAAFLVDAVERGVEPGFAVYVVEKARQEDADLTEEYVEDAAAAYEDVTPDTFERFGSSLRDALDTSVDDAVDGFRSGYGEE